MTIDIAALIAREIAHHLEAELDCVIDPGSEWPTFCVGDMDFAVAEEGTGWVLECRKDACSPGLGSEGQNWSIRRAFELEGADTFELLQEYIAALAPWVPDLFSAIYRPAARERTRTMSDLTEWTPEDVEELRSELADALHEDFGTFVEGFAPAPFPWRKAVVAATIGTLIGRWITR